MRRGRWPPRRPYELLGEKAKEGIRRAMTEMAGIEAGLQSGGMMGAIDTCIE